MARVCVISVECGILLSAARVVLYWYGGGGGDMVVVVGVFLVGSRVCLALLSCSSCFYISPRGRCAACGISLRRGREMVYSGRSAARQSSARLAGGRAADAVRGAGREPGIAAPCTGAGARCLVCRRPGPPRGRSGVVAGVVRVLRACGAGLVR